mgnify:CR=1 FL=1|jgi:peptidoglycan/xylan/chitin deacetylase (PgdA/CDA1 family)
MNNPKPRLYPAHIAGIVLIVAASGAFFLSPWISILLLSFYVILCVVACFLPQTQFLGPVIHRGRTGLPQVSITFDDGPSEGVTPAILELLDQYRVKAAFFVSGLNAKRHPDLVAEILARGHIIGNHSYHHFPYLMLKSRRVLFDEISKAQSILRDLGVETKAFRPPVGIVNPKLAFVLNDLDLICVTFSCRAFDAGNRNTHKLSNRILKKVKADDIILLHDVPARDDPENQWFLREIEKILIGVRNKGLTVVSLAELIGRDLMGSRPIGSKGSGLTRKKNFD